MRKVSTLKAKATTHQITEIDSKNWMVVSGSSGKVYAVRQVGNSYQCTCDWGTAGGNRTRNQSGCSHSLAVAAHVAAESGRKVSAHDGAEAAKRQHRPTVYLGQELFVTSRAS